MYQGCLSQSKLFDPDKSEKILLLDMESDEKYVTSTDAAIQLLKKKRINSNEKMYLKNISALVKSWLLSACPSGLAIFRQL